MKILKEHPHIEEFIRKLAQIQGLKRYKIVNISTNNKGEGFLGELFFVDMADEENHKTLHVVIKSAFKDEQIRDIAPIRLAFENEIHFYSDILPTFKKFESDRKARITTEITPKCLMVSMEQHNEVVALENLKSLGFEVFPRTDVLNDEHVRLIFETFGRFHAWSFGLKDQEPEIYEKLANKIANGHYHFVKPGFLSSNTKLTFELIYNHLDPNKDQQIMEKMERYLGDDLLDLQLELATSDRNSVIVHGDCWSNNFMFKYEDGNRTSPTEFRLLDFQLLRVNNPACDLSFCLFSGASKEIYDNLDKYLRIYHDSLSSHLLDMGSDPEKIYPFEALQKDWKHFAMFGLIMGMLLLKVKLTDSDSQLDFTDCVLMEDDKALLNSKFQEEEYFSRMRDVLEYLVQIDAL